MAGKLDELMGKYGGQTSQQPAQQSAGEIARQKIQSGNATQLDNLMNQYWQAPAKTNYNNNQMWRQKQAANEAARQRYLAQQNQGKRGLFKDNSVLTNKERDRLLKELNSLNTDTSDYSGWMTDDLSYASYNAPREARRKQIISRLNEIDAMLGNEEMEYNGAPARLYGAAKGAVKGWAGDQASFFGTAAEAGSNLSRQLGGNTSDYAGWATDDLSSQMIGHETDEKKYAQQLAEALKMQETGSRWSESGAKDIAKAESGLGSLGRIGIDLAANTVQMGMDAATAALSGGSGALIPLFTRAAGGGMRTAGENGASLQQRLLYGATIGGVEAATEMLSGGLAKIYGKGTADALTESIIRRMTSNPIGQKALLALADSIGEGTEEFISDLVEPFAAMLYNGKTLGQTAVGIFTGETYDGAEMLHDFIVGALMGGLGAGGKVMTGDYKAATQRMADTTAAEKTLTESGYDKKNARKYAEIIGRGLSGEELSGKEWKAVENKPTAQQTWIKMANEESAKAYVAEQFASTELTEDQTKVIQDGYTKDIAPSTYAAGTKEAYNLGKMGLTLETATSVASGNAAALNETQFRHAFELGKGEATTSTADVTTEEGKTALSGALAMMGAYAEEAASVYQEGQDVARFSAAMNKAASLYAASGADLQSIWQKAKNGEASDIISSLTQEQINKAAEIGKAMKVEQAAQIKEAQAKLAEIREKADAMQIGEGLTLKELNKQISDAKDTVKELQQQYEEKTKEIDELVKADPAAKETEAYSQMIEYAKQIQEAQKYVEAELKRLQEQKPKGKGKVTFLTEDGKVGDIDYKAVDQSKLTDTQKATVRIAEAISKRSGLDIRIVDFGDNVGGEYFKGGTIYLNINANYKGDNLAVGSLSHEVTHFLQEYSPDLYKQLKDVVVGKILENPQNFSNIFADRARVEASLTADEITDEMVANACMTILNDEATIQQIVNENRTLAEKIIDFITQIITDIKQAFSEIDTSSDFTLYQEVKAAEGAMDQMRELWLQAFNEAAENRNAQLATNENAASEGDVKKSTWEGQTLQEHEVISAVYDALDHADAGNDNLIKVGRMPKFVRDLTGIDGDFYLYRNHTYENIKTEKEAAEEGRLKEGAHYHGIGDKEYISAVMNLENPAVTVNDTTQKGNPQIVMVLPQNGSAGTPLVAAVGFYHNQPINGEFGIRPHIVLTIHEKIGDMESETGKHYDSLQEFIDKAVAQNRVISYSKELSDDLPVIGQHARLTNITASSLINNVAQFRKEVNDFRRKNKINYQTWESIPAATQEKIAASMSMDQARDMVQRAYNLADIREWFEGEYKNGLEWLKGEGAEAVAMVIENEFSLQQKYLDKIPALENEEIYVEQILQAYAEGRLTGSVTKQKATRLDTTQASGYEDSRFYAPKNISEEAAALWDTANQKATKNTQKDVYSARAKILFLAHSGDVAETLGITQAELNKKLRTWSRYSAKAIEVSKRINAGIPTENQWTGIQNCAIVNNINITTDEISSMVKSITGTSNEGQRRYIGRTMLALDTHIDWSRLAFEFKSGRLSGNARGLYSNNKIVIGGNGYANTVAHEMGHALDDIWGLDILGTQQLITESVRSPEKITDPDARQFYINLKAFMDNITDSADIRSSYTQASKEAFARFIARFVEFVDETAGNSFYHEQSYYSDRFTASQYIEFARLLQEKAMIDARRAADQQTLARAESENDEPSAAESKTLFQKWEGEEPKKTQYGFKLMNVDENGLPHAMFIDAAAPYELNTWYKADSPKMENLINLEPGYAYLVDSNDVADEESRKPISKVKGNFRGLPGKADINKATAEGKRWMVVDQYADGSKSIHNVGINGSGTVSTYALRPGIHAVDIPSMKHIGAKSEGSAKIDTRRPDQRWFLIEYPVDQDYNQEAYANETKDIRSHLPENGWYSYQTNSGAEAKQHWFITGGMKIVGPVSETDVRKYAQDRGFTEDLPWKNGKAYSEDDAINLTEYMRTTKAQPTPSKEEMRQRIEANQPKMQTWGEQVTMDDITNGEYSGHIHPMLRERMDAGKELNDRVRTYFGKVDPNSDWYLTPEQIDDLMEMNIYASRGDMTSADDIMISLSHLAQEQRSKTATYELMDDLLQHLSPVQQENWISQQYSVKDETFQNWYNKRHPSLYYPGYKRGDLANDANLNREVAYLKKVLQRNLQERDRIEAEELLAEYSKGNNYKRTFYQRWDNTNDDTAAEKNARELAYNRLASENMIISDLMGEFNKQKQTIEKLQNRLQLTKTPEVREADAKKMAGQILKDYDGTVDKAELTAQIKALGDALLQGASEQDLRTQARSIAADVIDSAEATESADSEIYQALKDRIKGAKLTIRSEYLGELDGDFQDFRRKNFGKFTLARSDSPNIDRSQYTSVDQFYTDLAAEFPHLLPAPGEDGAKNEGEYISTLAAMFDAGEEMTVNPFEQYMGEATEDLANRLIMDAMNGVLRPVTTDADRAKTRRQELQAQIKQLKAEQKLSDKEAANLWNTVADLTLKLDKAESQYKSLQVSSEARLSQLRTEGAARAVEAKARELSQIAALKQHYQEVEQKARQRRENTGVRHKIRKMVDDLNHRLAKPSENKHVPRELVQQTIDILKMIDYDSGRGGEKFKNKLADIRTMYEGYQNNELYAIAYDQTTEKMLKSLAEDIGDKNLYEMDDKQLGKVYDTLKSMIHVIDNAVKVRIGNEERNAFEVSKKMTQETRGLKQMKGWLTTKYLNAHLRPDVAFKRFGGFAKNSAWSDTARMLDDGQLKQTELKMKMSKPFAELTNNAAGMRDFMGLNTFGMLDESKLIDIGLKDAEGKPIKVTHEIAASIYMDLLNEDNRRHFINGGKRVPNLKDYYAGKGGWDTGSKRAVGFATELSDAYHELNEAKALEDEDGVKAAKEKIEQLKLSGEDYATKVQKSIESQLTDFDKKWITAAQNLLNVESKRYLNETTMDVYGIEKASVPNYYPIVSDSKYLAKPFEEISRDMNLENVGFMKERVKSRKPTLAMGLSSVINRQIDNVAQYCGLMPAVRDFNKIWNKTQAGYGDSIKDALADAFNGDANKYVENLIADLSGSRNMGDDSLGMHRLLGRLRGNLAQTTLTLNPRVALSQAASYPTAAAELDAKSLAKAFKSGKTPIRDAETMELIEKWSPLLYHRMQGFSTVELGDIKNSQRLTAQLWKKARWATGWIQAVDGATVGRLWYASEYWVQDHTSLEKGTDAYYEAVAKKFNDVVEKTQPNYTTMQRPAILRDPDEVVKSLTMFMTQRLQNFNILYDAAGSYAKMRADFAAKRNDVTQKDVDEARNQLVSSVSSQVIQAATFVAFKYIADAVMHNLKGYRDDDDELTKESISMQLIDNYLDAIMGQFLGGSELHSILKAATGNGKWYGVSMNGIDSVNDLIDSVVNLANIDRSTDKGKEKFNRQLVTIGKNLCQYLGIPAANATKIADAIGLHIRDAVNGELFSLEGQNTMKGEDIRGRQLMDALSKNNTAKIKEIQGTWKDKKDMLAALEPEIKEAFMKGQITEGNAQTLLTRAGVREKNAKRTAGEWAFEKETGLKYGDRKEAYMEGKISASDLEKWIVKVSGTSRLDAKNTIRDYDFEKKHKDEYEEYDLTLAQAKYWYNNNMKSKVSLGQYANQVAEVGLDKVKKYYEKENLRELTWKEYVKYDKSPIYDKDEALYGYKTYAQPAGISMDTWLSYVNVSDFDANNSVKQDEFGQTLLKAIENGAMDEYTAEILWKTFWHSKSSTTFAKWAKKWKKNH